MFPKKRRITKIVFDNVLKNGYVLQSPLFTVRFLKSNPTKQSQFAVIAPKGIAKKAVLRNSLRRKGYRAIQAINTHLGATILIFYKKPAIIATFEEIKTDIESLLKKI